MQREIKFRGQMTTGQLVFGLPHLNLPNSTAYFNECSYRICWNPETGGHSNAPIKNGTLSEFSGKHDKNGNEIYEFDVVKCIDNPTNYYTCEDVVIFKDGCFMLKDANLTLSEFGSEWIEVIGNVYDTPQQA
jgi:hypothetical protein